MSFLTCGSVFSALKNINLKYNVYMVVFDHDPRYHHAIFVEAAVGKTGDLIHVIGSIEEGMTLKIRMMNQPEDSIQFVSKTLVGKVSKGKSPEVAVVCRGILPPHKQYDGLKRINPSEPLRRCQEWNADAIKALKDAGILVPV